MKYLKKYAIPSIIILLYFIRCFYGFDWSDEAYYTAITKVIAEGGKYFKDITDAHMFMTVLFVPLIKLFKVFNVNYDGIIFYFRMVYFVFQFISYLFAYKVLKDKISNELLLQIICFLPFYSTHYIRSLSYNTVPFLCIYNIIILLYSKYNNDVKQIVVAILIAVSTFAYPSACILFFCFFIYFWKLNKEYNKYIIAFFLSIAVLGTCFLMNVDFTLISEGIKTAFADPAHSLGWKDKIAFLYYNLRDLTIQSYLWIAIPAIFIIKFLKLNLRTKMWLSEILITILILLIIINIKIDWKVNHSIFLFSIINVFLYIMYCKNKSILALFIFATSVVYAFSVFVFTDLGFFHSCEIMLFGMIGILIDIFSKNCKISWKILIVCDVVLMLILNYVYIYRDGFMWNSNSMIDEGSAKWLVTSEENYTRYKQIYELIKKDNTNSNGGKIIFYKLFPSGYLDSQKMPGVSTVWTYYDFFDISKETNTILILNETYGFGNKDLSDLESLHKYAKDNNMQKKEYECCIVYE